MNHLERFLAVMEYQPVDCVPNWELGVWPQTQDVWEAEGLDIKQLHWDWFDGETALGMDHKDFIPFYKHLIPPLEQGIHEEDERTVTFTDDYGRVRRALKEGTKGGVRMSMDQYLDFPVKTMESWCDFKRRLDPHARERYADDWQARFINPQRDDPLIFGTNTSTEGFYWFAREIMGTEGLSYALYDDPALVHDIMEFRADFLIEIAKPVLEHTTIDYIALSEDMAMKTGPLISPRSYRKFIFPRLRRVVDYFKSNGVRYVAVDTDGNPEKLIPMLMDAGVDIIWPLERAAGQDPVHLREKFGKSLRLWGGVDKRVLAQGPAAIDAHLLAMQPVIEEGGFIPTVDHTVPPDVSWANFSYYLQQKTKLLQRTLS